MYEIMVRIGMWVGVFIWGLLLAEIGYRQVENWMDDGESGVKKHFLQRIAGRGSWSYRNDYEVWFALPFLAAPVTCAILGVAAWFMFLNFFIPIAIVSFIGLAFTGRMVKRVKKGFTKHVDDKDIHVQRASE